MENALDAAHVKLALQILAVAIAKQPSINIERLAESVEHAAALAAPSTDLLKFLTDAMARSIRTGIVN